MSCLRYVKSNAGNFDPVVKVGELLLNGSAAELEWVTPTDVQVSWDTFRRFRDKGWSFTDCTSRAIIERLSLSSTAFAFDEHFRQFGSINVVPG